MTQLLTAQTKNSKPFSFHFPFVFFSGLLSHLAIPVIDVHTLSKQYCAVNSSTLSSGVFRDGESKPTI